MLICLILTHHPAQAVFTTQHFISHNRWFIGGTFPPTYIPGTSEWCARALSSSPGLSPIWSYMWVDLQSHTQAAQVCHLTPSSRTWLPQVSVLKQRSYTRVNLFPLQPTFGWETWILLQNYLRYVLLKAVPLGASFHLYKLLLAGREEGRENISYIQHQINPKMILHSLTLTLRCLNSIVYYHKLPFLYNFLVFKGVNNYIFALLSIYLLLIFLQPFL